MTQFKFKKRFGQNFLQNESIIDRIVDSISPTEKDLIIEIGPGAGALTKRLKKYSVSLIAYEIDEETKKYLLPLEDEKTKIVYKDFLTVDLKSEIDVSSYEHIYVIGNLPYYITTPIIEHIIDSDLPIESLTIMVQKEVADRFLATTKSRDYGYMTVLLNYHFEISKVVDVGKNNFHPAPKVDSAVVQLKTKEKQPIDYEKFKRILKNAFQFKRKTINNNLFNYDKEKLAKVLDDHGFTLSNRAEEIDLSTYIALAKEL